MRGMYLIVVALAVSCTAPVAAPSLSPTASAVSLAPPTPTVAQTQIAAPSPTATNPGAARVEIRQIQQLSAQVGLAVVSDGLASALWKTVDAGTHWMRLAVPPNTRIDALRFLDEQHGWALGFVLRDQPQAGCQQASTAPPCRSVVLTTEDGGRSWIERMSVPVDPNGGAETLGQLQATDAAHAWVIAQAGPCGHDGCLFQELRATSDGGTTWRALYSSRTNPTIPSLLRMASSDVGWMIGQLPLRSEQRILTTTDAGVTWRDVGKTVDALALDAASSRVAWILTRDGAFCTSSDCAKYELLQSADGGATWASLGNPKESACSSGQLRGPVFASDRTGYLGLDPGAGGVGATGGLMSSADGGRTWRCLTTPRNVTIISVADATNAWAISVDRSSGTTSLYRTTDAGSTWLALPSPRP